MMQGMLQRVFVRVVGFSDAERHALNTLFRLSRDKDAGRTHSYEPWLDDGPEAARLALIDGSHASAAQELNELRHNPDMGLIWVGSVSPAHAWRTFSRPLRWPEVVGAMDAYFAPPLSHPLPLDVNLSKDGPSSDFEAVSTLSPSEFSVTQIMPKRALVADADRDARLYLSSKLASVGITQIDESASIVQTKLLLEQQHYDFVSIDVNLQDQDIWSAVSIANRRKRIILITGINIKITTRLSGKIHDCVVMQKPLHPGGLLQLMQKA